MQVIIPLSAINFSLELNLDLDHLVKGLKLHRNCSMVDDLSERVCGTIR